MKLALVLFVQFTAGSAWADGFCDRFLVDSLLPIRRAMVPLHERFGRRADQTPPSERAATSARLLHAADALGRPEPRFTAHLLGGDDSIEDLDLHQAQARSFTVRGRAEIARFLGDVAPPTTQPFWRRSAWITANGRALRWALTSGSVAVVGYAWMRITGMDHALIWTCTGLAALGCGAVEGMDHAHGLSEQESLALIDQLLETPQPDHPPIFFGRAFGESSVHLLFTPADETLDVVWTYFETTDGV